MRWRWWTARAVLAFVVAAQLLPAHHVVRWHHGFDYVPAALEEEGVFVPDTYIWPITRKLKLFHWRFDIDPQKYDLVLLQYDQTFEESDEGFASFVVDELRIEFDDGAQSMLIDPSMPREGRTFPIGRSRATGHLKTTFERVVRPSDLTIIESGTAIREDGTPVPFRKVTRYLYRERELEYVPGFLELALRT